MDAVIVVAAIAVVLSFVSGVLASRQVVAVEQRLKSDLDNLESRAKTMEDDIRLMMNVVNDNFRK